MSSPRPSRLLLLAALSSLVATTGALTGCAAETTDDGASSSADAFTVAQGDRFVVSATPHKVVVKKKDGTAKFPFSRAALEGKTLVVHPVAGRAETGVVARALEVEDDGEHFVVTTTPLSLSEMERVAEDDVVRVYVDARKVSTRGVRPQGVADLLAPGNVAPQALSGFAFDGFDLSSGLDLGKPKLVQTGITFSHKIAKSRFEPEALVTWSKDEGLELGFRGELEWRSTLTLGGKVQGEVFRSRSVETPPLYVTVPVGYLPVPVALTAKATVQCVAALGGPMEVTVDIAADAKLGGSVRVHPTTDTTPDAWVRAGRWEPVATGSAKATLGAAPKLEGAISCALPRIELKASVAGVAGPYLAVSPSVSVGTDGVTMEGKVAAGVGAGMLGFGSGVEVNLYTWTP